MVRTSDVRSKGIKGGEQRSFDREKREHSVEEDATEEARKKEESNSEERRTEEEATEAVSGRLFRSRVPADVYSKRWKY